MGSQRCFGGEFFVSDRDPNGHSVRRIHGIMESDEDRWLYRCDGERRECCLASMTRQRVLNHMSETCAKNNHPRTRRAYLHLYPMNASHPHILRTILHPHHCASADTAVARASAAGLLPSHCATQTGAAGVRRVEGPVTRRRREPPRQRLHAVRWGDVYSQINANKTATRHAVNHGQAVG